MPSSPHKYPQPPRRIVPNPSNLPSALVQPPKTYGRLTRTHSEPRSYHASAVGGGMYHFYVRSDDWIPRRNAQVARMETQTRESKQNTQAAGVKSVMTWDLSRRDRVVAGEPFKELTKFGKLTSYDVNGFVYASSTKPVPPPEQNANPGHWVCEVNSTTGEFNVVNNAKPNPFNASYRAAEVARFRGNQFGQTPAAGQVQPTPVVTCFDIPSFVPVRKTDRAPNYTRIKPNL
mmetsp:Transcript_22286/g.56322  ORF Transcript_22286/g.56322 Transcript_22286/m.56322 type:complete len:232 (+) Transcript_22286:371-1066(+)|eukprot:g9891.t1